MEPEIERLERCIRELSEANAALERENEGWRRAERALQERELESKLIMDNIPNVVSLLTPSGTPERISSQILEYAGKTEDELKGWGGSDLVHSEDRRHARDSFEAGIRGGTSFEIIYRMRRWDGVYRWFHARHRPLNDSDGRVVRWCVAANDIDDVKHAEEALRESERNARSIIDGIPGLVATLAPDGGVEAVNRQILDYTGQTFEALQSWGTSGIVHPDDASRVAEIFLRSVTAGLAYEIEQRLRRHDGVYRWFSNRGTPAHDEAGVIVRWYVLFIDVDERRRAEDALRANEGTLLEIINTIPTTAWSTRLDGYCDFLSHRWLDYTGFSAQQAEGSGWEAVIHPDDHAALSERWRASLETGMPLDTEARMRRFDGVYRWFLFRANPLREESGAIVKWYGTNIDIEDRKRAHELRQSEATLRESQVNLLKIINTIPTTAWSTRPDGYCDFLSSRWLEYAGFSAEQAEGWGWEAAIHPDDAPGLVAQWRVALAAGTPVDAEARLRRFDGVYRWFLFRANPLRDEQGAIVKWYGTNIDIEEHKRGDRLRQSEFQSRLILNTIPGFVALFSPAGVLDGANEQFLGYLGLSIEEAGKWATNGAVHLDDLANTGAEFSASLASGQPYDFESRIRGADGVYRWFKIRGNPARDSDGRISRWYGLLTDIDDRKRAEEHRELAEEAVSGLRSELAHMSRVSSLGLLTASVAHEVNQPLAGIITNTSTCLRMLAVKPPNVEGALETVRRTMRDGNRASEVVGRLRALFLKQTAKSEEVDLNEAAAEVLPLASGDLQRNRVVLRLELADELPHFTADRVQLQQVILNLLLNASDAMKDVNDRERLAVIRTAPDGDGVRFSVEDVGVGFAEGEGERFFQPFYTTKSSGMGIGLSVSRSIIESHDGRIWGEPNAGRGATFSFSIPAALRSQL